MAPIPLFFADVGKKSIQLGDIEEGKGPPLAHVYSTHQQGHQRMHDQDHAVVDGTPAPSGSTSRGMLSAFSPLRRHAQSSSEPQALDHEQPLPSQQPPAAQPGPARFFRRARVSDEQPRLPPLPAEPPIDLEGATSIEPLPEAQADTLPPVSDIRRMRAEHAMPAGAAPPVITAGQLVQGFPLLSYGQHTGVVTGFIAPGHASAAPS